MKISAEKILTPEGFLRGTIHIANGVVQGIGAYEPGDIHCDIATPGLIDQHVHGGFGADVMLAGPDEMIGWLKFLATKGVTQVLSGVYTYPVPKLRAALENARLTMQRQAAGEGGARMIGVHLEGPFISKRALGAMMEEAVLLPTVENFKRVCGDYEDIIRLVTLAPEEPGAKELTGYLKQRGIAVEAGHTAATAEEGQVAFEFGVGGITHFFNASTPIHHRKPGILTAALLDDRVYAECICDMVHVHPDAVKLIYKCKGDQRMILVSDAVFTTGLPDGTYTSLDETYIVRNGESRMPDGALAGGSAVLIDEIHRLIDIGIPAESALRMASQTPAEFLRIPGGKIVSGARAEILCLDEDYNPICTVIGEEIAKGAAG